MFCCLPNFCSKEKNNTTKRNLIFWGRARRRQQQQQANRSDDDWENDDDDDWEENQGINDQDDHSRGGLLFLTHRVQIQDTWESNNNDHDSYIEDNNDDDEILTRTITIQIKTKTNALTKNIDNHNSNSNKTKAKNKKPTTTTPTRQDKVQEANRVMSRLLERQETDHHHRTIRVVKATTTRLNNDHATTQNKNKTTDEDGSRRFVCQEYLLVAAAIDETLEEQRRIVYNDDSYKAGVEMNRERGGLVLNDGSVNPGHFCFGAKPDAPPFSPLSQIQSQKGGCVRVGDCAEVYTGWDHTEVWGNDPNTYHYAELVYAHFHVHADNTDLGEYRRRRRSGRDCDDGGSGIGGVHNDNDHGTGDGGDDVETKRGSESETLGTTTEAKQPQPQQPLINSNHNNKNDQPLRESTPSLGDIGAWIGYHRNLPRAFVVTRNTNWLLYKWKVPGHHKDGIECPLPTITPWLEECQKRCYESITCAPKFLEEISNHGFVIYTKKKLLLLGEQQADSALDHHRSCEADVGDGVYQLWNCTNVPTS